MAEPYTLSKHPRFGPSLKSGGGDGTSGGMETRVKALEDKFDKIDSKLDGIVKDAAEIKGRLSSMPSTWQVVGICASMLALALAGGGAMLALVRATSGN